MGKFQVTAPDGKSYEITAPEGATQEQVLDYAKQHYGGQPGPTKAPESQALRDAREAFKGDEIPGALTHGQTLGFMTDVDATVARIATMAKNKVKEIKGEKAPYGSEEAAAATKQAETEKQKEFQNKHPVGHAATEFAGSMMIPGLKQADAALKGIGVGSGLARTALTGAGLGGAAAVGNSEGGVTDRLKAAPGGAVAGGLTGGLLHGGGSVVGRLGSGLSEAGSRIKTGIEELFDIGSGGAGEMTPKRLAKGEKVGQKYVADLAKKLDPTGQKLRANPAEAAGKPITAAEALGGPAQTQLKVLGRRQGKTTDELRSQLTQRQREAGDRVVDDFHQVTGIDPEAARGNLETQSAELRAKAKPLYDNWHAQKDVDSPVLQDLLKTHSVKEGLNHAKAILSDEHEEAHKVGLAGEPVPLMKKLINGKIVPFTQDGKPVMVPREEAFALAKSQGFKHPSDDGSAERIIPTAKGWDYIKRGLDESLEQYRDKNTGRLNVNSPKARALLKVRTELSDELTNTDRHWGAAAKTAFDAGGDPIRQEEAFNGAKKLLSNNTRGWQFDKVLERYTPAQKEALKAGVVSEVREAAQAGRTRLRELLTDSTILKLQHIFGHDQAEELVKRMTMESDMAKTGARMAPGVGSDTSETMLGAAEQSSGMQDASRAVKQAFKGNWVDALGHAIAAPIVGVYRGAQAPINEAARDMAGALLRKNPSELARILEEQGATKEEASKAVQILREHGAFAAKLIPTAAAATAGASQARN